MKDSGIILKRLYKVRFDSFFEQECHSAHYVKVARKNRSAIELLAYIDIAYTPFEVRKIL